MMEARNVGVLGVKRHSWGDAASYSVVVQTNKIGMVWG